MAAFLHKTVAEIQASISASEFLGWMEYMEMDANDFHREDWYLAQIAAEVRRSRVMNPQTVELNDLLLRFVNAKTEEEKMRDSKMAWLTFLGLNGANNG